MMREGLVLLTYKNAHVNEFNFLKTSLSSQFDNALRPGELKI